MPTYLLQPHADLEREKQKYIRYHPHAFVSQRYSNQDLKKIYDGLMLAVIKPAQISVARFKKIMELKAKILHIFLYEKVMLDKIFDELEKSVAINMAAIGISEGEIKKRNLYPKKYAYKEYIICDKRVKEPYYFPIITKEILEMNYPYCFLLQVLNQQLQKNNINVPNTIADVKLFSKTEGWFLFAGVVPRCKGIEYVKRGMIFIDAPEYTNTDSRHHAAFSHAIQEYMISKLIEHGDLGDLSVSGESDIDELELLKADAWELSLRTKDKLYLFDIMRERLLFKSVLINYYPEYGFGFTSPYYLNQYLILNPRFPCLSTLLFNFYATGSLSYFKINSKIRFFNQEHSATFFKLYPMLSRLVSADKYFTQTRSFNDLTRDQQISVMNRYQEDTDTENDIHAFRQSTMGLYKLYELTAPKSRVLLKKRMSIPFTFAQADNDSESYLKTMKKLSRI